MVTTMQSEARMPSPNEGRLEFANSLRGIAALMVVYSHYVQTFFLARPTIAAVANFPVLTEAECPNPFVLRMFPGLPMIEFACLGITLFFILSGFVIPFSFRRSTRSAFLVGRIFRLLPTYVCGLSVTLGMLWIGSWYYTRPFPHSLKTVLIHYVPGIRDVLWSPHIDCIIWTLEIEVKFYLLCACLSRWLREGSLKVFAVPVVLAMAMGWLSPRLETLTGGQGRAYQLGQVAALEVPFLILMFIGVALNYRFRRMISLRTCILCVISIFALFAATWSIGRPSSAFGSLWYYAGATILFAAASTRPNWFKSNRLFGFFARISYPLYVVHGIGGYVAMRIAIDHGWAAWQALTLATASAIFIAWLIHVAVEAPSQRLGKSLAARWFPFDDNRTTRAATPLAIKWWRAASRSATG